MVQGEGLLWPRLLLIPLGLLGLTPTWVMDELVQPAGHKTSLQHMPNLFVELAPEGTARRHCPSNLWWEEVTGGNMELRFPSSWGESVRQCRCNYIMLPFYLWHFSKWHWLADRWLKVFTKKIKECTKRNGGKNYGEAESTNQEIENKKGWKYSNDTILTWWQFCLEDRVSRWWRHSACPEPWQCRHQGQDTPVGHYTPCDTAAQ